MTSKLLTPAVLLLVGVCAHATPAKSETLRFGFHGTLCPVVCDPAKDGQNGFVMDIMNEIGAPAGINAVLHDLPKTRLLQDLDEGRLDVLLLPVVPIAKSGLKKTDIPAVKYTMGVLKRTGFEFQFTGVESLKKVVWGVVSGERWFGAYQEYLDNHKGGNVVEVFGTEAYERLVKMTALKRVDIVIANYDMLERKRLRSGSADSLVVDRTNVFGKFVPLHLAFGKNNPESERLAKFFTKGLRRLAMNGRIREILAAYGVGEWAGINAEDVNQ